YRRLLERRGTRFEEGEVVDTAGKVVGRHAGHQRYTIGQRRGVRLALGRPVYVVGVDPAENRVMVGDREDLLATGLVANQVNLIATRAVNAWEPIRCQAKIRYNAQPVGATLRRTDDHRF